MSRWYKTDEYERWRQQRRREAPKTEAKPRDWFEASDPFMDIFATFFGGSGVRIDAPPVNVPMRILGLDAKPSSRETVKAAFRRRLFDVHPDLAAYTDPSIRAIHEKAMADDATVQELVWARDVLYRLIPQSWSGDGLDITIPKWKPPTEEEQHERREREWRGRQYGEVCGRCGHAFEADEIAYLFADWPSRKMVRCADCRGDVKTDEPQPCRGCDRPVAVSPRFRRYGYEGPTFDEQGDLKYTRPKVYVICSERCAGRESRRQRRERHDPEPIDCQVCGERMDTTRGDARYCSAACRQKAYRIRRAVGTLAQ
jgi:hypothetical protein